MKAPGARSHLVAAVIFALVLAAGAPAAFRGFLGRYLKIATEGVGDRASRLRHRHPWFGQLTARQWHWLAGAHQGLHGRQVRRIVGGLS